LTKNANRIDIYQSFYIQQQKVHGKFLGVVISKLVEVSNISATAIVMVVGAGAVVYRSLNEWKEKTKEIETNQMFFYYKAGGMLKNIF